MQRAYMDVQNVDFCGLRSGVKIGEWNQVTGYRPQ